MHYVSFMQFLGQNYQVLMLRKDRSKSINAASGGFIADINLILHHISNHEISKTGYRRGT